MVRSNSTYFAVLFGSTCVAALLAGCDRGPRIVPVAGKVLIDGKPVTGGFVRFVPNDARSAYGEIDKSGHFRLTTFEDNDGCVVGTHQVEIIAKEFPTDTSTKWLTPKKYADLSTSGVAVDVTEPKDDLILELTWDGGKPFVEYSQSVGDKVP